MDKQTIECLDRINNIVNNLSERIDIANARLDRQAALIQDLQGELDRYKAMARDDEEDRIRENRSHAKGLMT